MSDTASTPDPDGAIYPDGVSSSDADMAARADDPDFAPGDPRRFNEPPQPPVTGESGTPLVNEKPEYHEPGTCDGDKCYTHGDDYPSWPPETPSTEHSQPATPGQGQLTAQVNGEMLIANLLVEIANLTKRAIMAETMVQMYQQAAQPSQPKPAQ